MGLVPVTVFCHAQCWCIKFRPLNCCGGRNCTGVSRFFDTFSFEKEWTIPFPSIFSIQGTPIIVSERLPPVRDFAADYPIRTIFGIRARHFRPRCSWFGSKDFPAVSRVFPRHVTTPGHRVATVIQDDP